jgi:glycosyltransferase involved in cell wall biosynthesis
VSPDISVIIPVRDGARWIADAVRSIQRQAVASTEIVVVDDGSTDRTREIVERCAPGCRYRYQANAGPAAARNAGMQIARGTLIGFLDADDLQAEGALADLRAALARVPSADIAMGRVQALHGRFGANRQHGFEPRGAPVLCYHVGSILARRSVFERVGPFDTRLGHCEDVDWFMRAQECRTAFEMLDRVVLLYRRHEHNMSRDAAKVSLHLTRVMKGSLDRRRKIRGTGSAGVPLDEIYYVRPGRLRA